VHEHIRPCSSSLLAPLLILPFPLTNALSSINLR
jgi:hypothetical protein